MKQKTDILVKTSQEINSKIQSVFDKFPFKQGDLVRATDYTGLRRIGYVKELRVHLNAYHRHLFFILYLERCRKDGTKTGVTTQVKGPVEIELFE